MSDLEREVDPICPYGPSGCQCYRTADEERGLLAEWINEQVVRAAEAYEKGDSLPCGCACHAHALAPKPDDWDDRIGRP